jgi:putative transposase
MYSTVNQPYHKTTIVSTKSISFHYTSPTSLHSLFEAFRSMCNDGIRIAASAKPRSRFKLIEYAYPRLKEYGLHTHYILSACEVAYSVYSNENRRKNPLIKRFYFKLDNQSYRLDHLLLRIPTTSRSFIFLVLQGSVYHLSFLENRSLKRGSVTITPNSVIIAFSREVEVFEPVWQVGIDINERNLTVSATNGWHRRFEEPGEIVEIKERYKNINAGIAHKTRGDRRVAQNILSRYGKRERDRTTSRLHKITKQIVSYAFEHEFGIKMEKLTGIRKLYRKGNGQGAYYRGRMNSWVFGETQRQVDYKSRWVGVPVWYVNPRGTSSYCLCGSRVVPLADRKLYCPKCDKTWDRDDLASKNIMACAVPQARPPGEAVMGNPGRRRTLVIPGADGGKGKFIPEPKNFGAWNISPAETEP